MFNMFKILRVLGCVHQKSQCTFNMSQVMSKARGERFNVTGVFGHSALAMDQTFNISLVLWVLGALLNMSRVWEQFVQLEGCAFEHVLWFVCCFWA